MNGTSLVRLHESQLKSSVCVCLRDCRVGHWALLFYRRAKGGETGESLKLRNPFELSTVLFFGGTLAVILPLAKLATDYLGAGGLFALAALTGLVDVDPIVLSASRLAGGSIDASNAVLAILIAAGANILGKSIIAVSAGGIRFGLPLAVSGAIAFLVSLAVWLFIRTVML